MTNPSDIACLPRHLALRRLHNGEKYGIRTSSVSFAQCIHARLQLLVVATSDVRPCQYSALGKCRLRFVGKNAARRLRSVRILVAHCGNIYRFLSRQARIWRSKPCQVVAFCRLLAMPRVRALLSCRLSKFPFLRSAYGRLAGGGFDKFFFAFGNVGNRVSVSVISTNFL